MRFLSIMLISVATTACVSTSGWVQAGKSTQDQKRDNGECRAQASQTCNGNGFCVNHAYGECMEGRGWQQGG
jgi:hypothetical protein